MRLGPSCIALVFLVGCASYRPARFALRPPVTDAHDDAPIALPVQRRVPEPVYLSEVYLHRPLREAMELATYPDAGDVNSFDEVVRSSWFAPRSVDVGAMARGPETPGPPRPPFQVLPDEPMGFAAPSMVILDARGQRYEIATDPADRPEMRTGASAIAARLVWALGFNTPPVSVIEVRAQDFWRGEGAPPDVTAPLREGPAPRGGLYRVAALAFPRGSPVGTAAEAGTRGDDPNDLVPHEDRRTLRALKVFASWLLLDGPGVRNTVDSYVGPWGQGHLVHHFAALDSALGAGNVVRASDAPPADGGGTPLHRLITLGLAPADPPSPTQVTIASIGALDGNVDPETFGPSVPYEPADRLLAQDGYWAAKRIAELSRAHIALAIDAGRMSDRHAQTALQSALEERRNKVLSYWFEVTSPLELISLSGSKVVLRDEGLRHGIVRPGISEYRIVFMKGDGQLVQGAWVHKPTGAQIEFTLPALARHVAEDYLVVQVTARRDHRALPRPFEMHLKAIAGRLVVLGIRH